MYVGALCDIISDTDFIAVCNEIVVNLESHALPAVSIERILAYRGVGHAVLHHALRGYVSAVRDLPVVAKVHTELRPHGPQWLADAIAESALPPENELAPRVIPDPLPELWENFCRAKFSKQNLEDAVYSVLAQCGGHDGYVRIPDSAQYTSLERLRRVERTIVPLFGKFGFEQGGPLSLDTVLATAYAYYDDATAVPVASRMKLIRSVLASIMRESGARDAALLEGRRPDEVLPVHFVIPRIPEA